MLTALRLLDARLRGEGFQPGAPSGEIAAQDENVCARWACTRCGSPQLRYRPYVHGGRRSFFARYRAFSVCATCGHVREF